MTIIHTNYCYLPIITPTRLMIPTIASLFFSRLFAPNRAMPIETYFSLHTPGTLLTCKSRGYSIPPKITNKIMGIASQMDSVQSRYQLTGTARSEDPELREIREIRKLVLRPELLEEQALESLRREKCNWKGYSTSRCLEKNVADDKESWDRAMPVALESIHWSVLRRHQNSSNAPNPGCAPY